MSKPEPRIPYIKREEWTEATPDVFGVLARSEEEREEARKNGSTMNMMNVFANHPPLTIPFLETGKVLYGIQLPMRLREIAILRLAHLSNSEYEWFQHVAMGKFAGLTDADIDAIKKGEPAAGWSEVDGLMIEAVNDLEGTDTISDATWEKMAAHFDRQALFEFVFMISYYKMTAWMLNAMAIPVDETPQGSPPK